ncbi:Asr1405/Asl0597 family protein [Allocoleopsis franciscana]|uniref:Uncharacterized protein n=1 Tax=Allocoleopsis franciscana PCC 7113 TaxID=1173027 RepID=K9WQ98_9CYAN|nr:Asr1405/Asl0597 family protein [Allocoleopsis franciscana]AFZ21722.1 hypothetical protein Mic7113_6128 [Allocoleopsis franciscana PCC 7113]
MNRSGSKIETKQDIEISWGDRWQVYRRLQELAIPCECGTNQPLRYQLNDVTAAIQLWSVVRQLTVPRRELACWLERCWQIRN